MTSTYMRLYEHYRQMFLLVDSFCFNSSNTRRIYAEHLQVPPGSTVLPMVHAGIADHRVARDGTGTDLRLGFIGSEAPFKGLPLLRAVLAELQQEGVHNWSLSVWGGRRRAGAGAADKKLSFRGSYAPHEMKTVFDQMDLLVVPSICNETFSLITLEALSYGLPVLTSATVGAKDIVASYAQDFVFTDRSGLKATLGLLCQDREPLKAYHQHILEREWPFSHEAHVRAVKDWYTRSLQESGA